MNKLKAFFNKHAGVVQTKKNVMQIISRSNRNEHFLSGMANKLKF
jgi:hypothetical protein